ncbi:P-loop containing nucleoside triphosphate hydrolase protein [Panus rudis PR-1116 ss-1]|nr:P-loop containing nucleoside triphosphate hydrolase protein [Panus rudis PR-1116 ss-1]
MSSQQTTESRPFSHEEVAERSRRNLEHARARAAREYKYNSQECRKRMAEGFRARTGGKCAYDWQLDAAECALLGVNGVFIARTGAGKTTPFLLPFCLRENKDKVTIVISPLKALQREQARRFRKLGIRAQAVNGDNWSSTLEKEILAGKYRVLFMGPEMVLSHAACRDAIMSLGSKGRIMSFLVDEAHCISQWGGDFRPKYSELGQLRSFVPPAVPILAFSATVTPATLHDIETTLQLHLPSGFYFNMGNDRPNVKMIVKEMRSSDDYEALGKILELDKVVTPSDIPKTIIFANDRNDVERIWRYLTRKLPSDMRATVAFYHSFLSRRTKKIFMRRFVSGSLRILVATEAVGMGADIPDIELVIQFGAPLSLDIWVQRAGRAGRIEAIQATAYILVEKAVFKLQKPRKARQAKDPPRSGRGSRGKASKLPLSARRPTAGKISVGVNSDTLHTPALEFKKKIPDSLRQFLNVPESGCRRKFLNEYYNNPPSSTTVPMDICCDRCSDRYATEQAALIALMHEDSSPPSSPSLPATLTEHVEMSAPPSSTPTTTGHKRKRSPSLSSVSSDSSESSTSGGSSTGDEDVHDETKATAGTKYRGGNHYREARQALLDFRYSLAHERYKGPFTAAAVLPDHIIKTLAHDKSFKSVNDITSRRFKSWPIGFARRHAQDILDVLRDVDDRFSRQTTSSASGDQKRPEASRDSAVDRRVDLTTPSVCLVPICAHFISHLLL